MSQQLRQVCRVFLSVLNMETWNVNSSLGINSCAYLRKIFPPFIDASGSQSVTEVLRGELKTVDGNFSLRMALSCITELKR